MRLKTSSTSLSIHNGNTALLNSPKRLNTVELSNQRRPSTGGGDTVGTEGLLNNINNGHEPPPIHAVQWALTAANNLINQRLVNINNNLATVEDTHGTGGGTVGSLGSPDDSILDYEDAQQSGASSADVSPQDEDREFSISDSDSLSDDGNTEALQRRGIVNPNYPGFQHLAHTLDYIKVSDSDTEEPDPGDLEDNNFNNNNPESVIDKIDSVNRLDSIENIQKVYYDKPVLDLNCENQNLPVESGGESEFVASCALLDNQNDVYEEEAPELPQLEQATIRELEDDVDKIVLSLEKETSVKYNIEPNNINRPFEKLSPSKIYQPAVLEDTEIVKVLNTPFDETKSSDLEIKEASSIMNILHEESRSREYQTNINDFMSSPAKDKIKTPTMSDAFLSNCKENLPKINARTPEYKPEKNNMEVDDALDFRDSNREMEEIEKQIKKIKSDTKLSPSKLEEIERFCKEDITKGYKEKDVDSSFAKRKSRMQFNYLKKRPMYQFGGFSTIQRRDLSIRNNRDIFNRRSMPNMKENTTNDCIRPSDVCNIETNLPSIDLESIENHLRAAREEERKRRLDREEIRRRLTMGSDYDDYYTDRPRRKPSLHARLQSGMNLQICFMNETVSDNESPSSDNECPLTNPKQSKTTSSKKSNSNLSVFNETQNPPTRPATLLIGEPVLQPASEPVIENDFFSRQARLQTEARMALAQAKQMARMQMEIEKQKLKVSPITEMVRNSLQKIGIPFPEDKRRLSRLILTDMNPKQLKVIVNDLHNQIKILNENLVKLLMDRDDLHMEQDSMLVDIEDLTRYLGAKEQAYREQQQQHSLQNNNPPSPAPSSPLAALNSTMKPHLHRIASLVKK